MQEGKTINFGEALADFVAEQEYGSIIHYQDIEHVTKERYGSQRYYRYIATAKSILESKGKMMKSIGGRDYQILYPGDYSAAYAREVNLAKKRIKHGGKILKGAPVNDMTPDERQTFNRISDFHTRLDALACENYAEVKRLLKSKNHPLLAGTEQGVTTHAANETG